MLLNKAFFHVSLLLNSTYAQGLAQRSNSVLKFQKLDQASGHVPYNPKKFG